MGMVSGFLKFKALQKGYQLLKKNFTVKKKAAAGKKH